MGKVIATNGSSGVVVVVVVTLVMWKKSHYEYTDSYCQDSGWRNGWMTLRTSDTFKCENFSRQANDVLFI